MESCDRAYSFNHTLFFYKDGVFSAEAEKFLFSSADFRLKIFLGILLDYIAYDISVFECI